MKQKLIRFTLVGALALGMSSVVAAPGGAAAPLQSCKTLTGSATLTPGLGTVPKNQAVKATGKLATCTPSAKTGGAGTITSQIKLANGSCQGLAGGGQKLSGTATTTWKNKKVSKYTLTFTTGKGANITVATIAGKVSSGLFVGHKVTGQIKFTVKSGQDCSPGKPVKNLTFKNTKPWVIV